MIGTALEGKSGFKRQERASCWKKRLSRARVDLGQVNRSLSFTAAEFSGAEDVGGGTGKSFIAKSG